VHLCTTTCSAAPNPASLPRQAPALPRALRFRTLPPCHLSHGFRPRLPGWEGSGAATCNTALDPASLLERALVLPHAPRLWTPPLYSGGLRCYHVSRGSEPCLPTRGGGLWRCHVSHDPQRAANLKNIERLSCNGM
jgi:hypothetical protein